MAEAKKKASDHFLLTKFGSVESQQKEVKMLLGHVGSMQLRGIRTFWGIRLSMKT